MFKKKSTRNIGQSPISWEKRRPTGPEGASDKTLNP